MRDMTETLGQVKDAVGWIDYFLHSDKGDALEWVDIAVTRLGWLREILTTPVTGTCRHCDKHVQQTDHGTWVYVNTHGVRVGTCPESPNAQETVHEVL